MRIKAWIAGELGGFVRRGPQLPIRQTKPYVAPVSLPPAKTDCLHLRTASGLMEADAADGLFVNLSEDGNYTASFAESDLMSYGEAAAIAPEVAVEAAAELGVEVAEDERDVAAGVAAEPIDAPRDFASLTADDDTTREEEPGTEISMEDLDYTVGGRGGDHEPPRMA